MKTRISKDIPLSPNVIARKEFLDDLPKRIRNTVRGVDLTLINEAITAVLEGHATINGNKPISRAEKYIVIATYFKAARTPLNMFFEGALTVNHNYIVTFKLKDKIHTIKFPENPADN